jgi:ATP-dependent Clp protease ATP-binding subunit ClpB
VASELYAQERSLGFHRHDGIGAPRQPSKHEVARALRPFLPPDLIDLIDCVVPFRPLTPADVREAARRELESTAQWLGRHGKDLQIDDSALHALSSTGYDAELGLRLLKRTIERNLLEPLAALFYEPEWREGRTLRVLGAGEGIRIEVVR